VDAEEKAAYEREKQGWDSLGNFPSSSWLQVCPEGLVHQHQWCHVGLRGHNQSIFIEYTSISLLPFVTQKQTKKKVLANGLRKCGIYTQWNFMQP
jgi:hypothetical protein